MRSNQIHFLASVILAKAIVCLADPAAAANPAPIVEGANNEISARQTSDWCGYDGKFFPRSLTSDAFNLYTLRARIC